MSSNGPFIERVDQDITRERISALLADQGLPVDDLSDEMVELSCICENGAPMAAIGLERHGETGLLRSLVVTPSRRGEGLAGQLVKATEADASNHGIRNLYLLTNTAENFFLRQAFEVVPRNQVPSIIRQTKQFSTLCPDTATVMHKDVKIA